MKANSDQAIVRGEGGGVSSGDDSVETVAEESGSILWYRGIRSLTQRNLIFWSIFTCLMWVLGRSSHLPGYLVAGVASYVIQVVAWTRIMKSRGGKPGMSLEILGSSGLLLCTFLTGVVFGDLGLLISLFAGMGILGWIALVGLPVLVRGRMVGE